MEKIDLDAINLEKISFPGVKKKDLDIYVLRLDKVHPVISGNKWFKLQYYLEDARHLQKRIIVTRGGAWSNHIVATAAACRIQNFQSIGLIRGEAPGFFSSTLKMAKESGMKLVFLSRQDYRDKKIPVELQDEEYYFIDEGGYGRLGMLGASTILTLAKQADFTHIVCAVGTGTMLAGLSHGARPGQQVVGISVLKGNYSLAEAVNALAIIPGNNFIINHDYHFGGYAQGDPILFEFMNEFYRQTKIPTDFVYTGKLFYALNDLLKKDFFPAPGKLMVIHSGGLQGNASLDKGTLMF